LHASLRNLVCAAFSVAWFPLAASGAEAIPVKLVTSPAGFQLIRDGKPYLAKGVGGETKLDVLSASGGNSVRTWGVDNLDKVLADAQKNGLTVAVGLWLGHERHGFNYNDADQVAGQLEKCRATIEKYKDHPAVLLWGIGNEMEGYEKGDNAAIWSAVNSIAALAKKLDPNHPTMTVVAEIGGDRVKNIHRLCPEIDIVGINSYGGAATIAKRYREAGGSKPYILTEYGPPGSWEVKKSAWGSAIEPTSSEKAAAYRKTYEQGVLGSSGLCVGSYAFLWGQKQEATPTWFGLFLASGERTEAADVLQELWTGKGPANNCPRIEVMKIEGKDQVDPGNPIHVKLATSDPDNDSIKVQWVVQAEPAFASVGGDKQAAPPTFPKAIVHGTSTGANLTAPKDGGGYRVFAYVVDSNGGSAVANVPFQVAGEVRVPDATVPKLPLVLYDEGSNLDTPYIPAGYMGNTKGVKMTLDHSDEPHAGKSCIRVADRDAKEWAGVVWQSPAQDWGDQPGGYNWNGAKKLTFWARGEKGGEAVSFEFGLLKTDKKFHDTANGKLDAIKLTDEWKQYSIDLEGKDLSRIKTGFAWVYAADGHPAVFYLDDIVVE
jgi:hypothetical protein